MEIDRRNKDSRRKNRLAKRPVADRARYCDAANGQSVSNGKINGRENDEAAGKAACKMPS